MVAPVSEAGAEPAIFQSTLSVRSRPWYGGGGSCPVERHIPGSQACSGPSRSKYCHLFALLSCSFSLRCSSLVCESCLQCVYGGAGGWCVHQRQLWGIGSLIVQWIPGLKLWLPGLGSKHFTCRTISKLQCLLVHFLFCNSVSCSLDIEYKVHVRAVWYCWLVPVM